MCPMHLTKPQEILNCYTKEAEVFKSEVMIKSMLTYMYKSHVTKKSSSKVDLPSLIWYESFRFGSTIQRIGSI